MSTLQIPRHIEFFLNDAENFAKQAQGIKIEKHEDQQGQTLVQVENGSPFQRTIAYQSPHTQYYYSPFTHSITHAFFRSFFSWLFPTHHHVHHHNLPPVSPPSQPKKQDKDKGGGAVIVSIATLALAAFIAYSIGKDFAMLGDVAQDEKQIKKENQRTEEFLKTAHLDPYIKHQFQDVMELQQSILKDYRHSAYRNILVKGTTLSGLALSAIAHFGKLSSEYQIAGGVLTGVGTVAWIIKAGLESMSNQTEKLSQRLYDTVLNLKFDLFTNN